MIAAALVLAAAGPCDFLDRLLDAKGVTEDRWPSYVIERATPECKKAVAEKSATALVQRLTSRDNCTAWQSLCVLAAPWARPQMERALEEDCDGSRAGAYSGFCFAALLQLDPDASRPALEAYLQRLAEKAGLRWSPFLRVAEKPEQLKVIRSRPWLQDGFAVLWAKDEQAVAYRNDFRPLCTMPPSTPALQAQCQKLEGAKARLAQYEQRDRQWFEEAARKQRNDRFYALALLAGEALALLLVGLLLPRLACMAGGAIVGADLGLISKLFVNRNPTHSEQWITPGDFTVFALMVFGAVAGAIAGAFIPRLGRRAPRVLVAVMVAAEIWRYFG